MRYIRQRALGLCLALVATPLAAMEVHLRDSFHFPRAASLAWDPELCALWVAIEGPQLFLITPSGRELRRMEPGFRSIRSVTVDGDALLIADGWGGFQRIARDGSALGAPFVLAPGLRDVEGLHRMRDGSYLVVEDDPSRVMRIDPDGTMLMERIGSSFEPRLDEPQGVAVDPMTGNILIVDDNEGLNALIELTPNGEVLSVTPMAPYGFDAEGVAVFAEAGLLFVGFDSGERIAVFDYLPTRAGSDPSAALPDGPGCPIS